jgi:hypothetical protein
LFKIILQGHDLFPVVEQIEISAPCKSAFGVDIPAAQNNFQTMRRCLTHVGQLTTGNTETARDPFLQ